ncbi:hypothetical protein RF11_14346 [Thelohanellus kitauei]|uniref:Uncharacterized protein n=1 Tax=Thelohanellus kitauei TaxID=669202 RepID=A0A0C2IJH0_THEKT|nr:hypothetical protein RF11_14346 [Thelohanellus kitauei]
MRELFPSLDKVRWHKRFDKCASLSKLLRYKMATKDILSGFETFLNLEKVLKEHDSLLSAPDELSEESASSIMAVLMSLESFMIQKNQFTEDTLLFDRTLNIIKCHIILHNHQQALRLIFDQNKSIIDGFKIVERSQDYSKYTWRLVAEVLIGACSIVYDRKDYAGYLNACFQFSCTAVEILFELIRFQESVIVKHVKSTSSIYRELVDLLLWASYYFSVIGCKLKVNLRDIRYSLLVLVKNVNILNSDGHEFIVPIHKLRISMYLIEWFRFDLENPEETIKCIFSLAVPDILTPRVVLPTQTPPLCIIIKEILVILNSSINQDSVK